MSCKAETSAICKLAARARPPSFRRVLNADNDVVVEMSYKPTNQVGEEILSTGFFSVFLLIGNLWKAFAKEDLGKQGRTCKQEQEFHSLSHERAQPKYWIP